MNELEIVGTNELEEREKILDRVMNQIWSKIIGLVEKEVLSSLPEIMSMAVSMMVRAFPDLALTIFQKNFEDKFKTDYDPESVAKALTFSFNQPMHPRIIVDKSEISAGIDYKSNMLNSYNFNSQATPAIMGGREFMSLDQGGYFQVLSDAGLAGTKTYNEFGVSLEAEREEELQALEEETEMMEWESDDEREGYIDLEGQYISTKEKDSLPVVNLQNSTIDDLIKKSTTEAEKQGGELFINIIIPIIQEKLGVQTGTALTILNSLKSEIASV